jgi:hypothetical protein
MLPNHMTHRYRVFYITLEGSYPNDLSAVPFPALVKYAAVLNYVKRTG